MVIEFNLQHIMILLQLEQLLYVEMEPIALVGIDEGHAPIMAELQDGYNEAKYVTYLSLNIFKLKQHFHKLVKIKLSVHSCSFK